MDRGQQREIPPPPPSKEKVLNKYKDTGVTEALILGINKYRIDFRDAASLKFTADSHLQPVPYFHHAS